MRQTGDGAKQSTRRGGPVWRKTCKHSISSYAWMNKLSTSGVGATGVFKNYFIRGWGGGGVSSTLNVKRSYKIVESILFKKVNSIFAHFCLQSTINLFFFSLLKIDFGKENILPMLLFKATKHHFFLNRNIRLIKKSFYSIAYFWYSHTVWGKAIALYLP